MNAKLPMPHLPSSAWLSVLVVAVFAGLGVWLRPPGLVGDTDVVRIANGMLHAHARGMPLDPAHAPGFAQHFGYYATLALALPASVYRNGTTLLDALSLVGLMSGVLAFGAYALLAWRRFGEKGVLATALVTLSPMTIALSYSGHPLLPSAALLFLGAVLVHPKPVVRAGIALGLEIAAVVLWVGSLTVRAEALLAMPWLVALAWEGPSTGRGARLARRLAIVGLSVITFGVIQNRMIPHSSGARELRAFLEVFLGRDTYSRAGMFMLLGIGVGTWVIAAVGLLRGALRPELRSRLILALVLVIPTVVFWIPVPAPSRHFFYALVGLSELALLAVRWREARAFALLALTVVVANFALAEALYGPISRRYAWKYPAMTSRRATVSVPLGWFLPDRNAIGRMLATSRDEGRRLAAFETRDVLAFADESPLMVMAFVERGDVTHLCDTLVTGMQAEHLARGSQHIYIIRKSSHWPRDVEATLLARDPFPHAAIYTQPHTLSSYDVKRDLFPERRLHIDDLPRVVPNLK
ncbi:MAG TPA: hypothetical protein VEY91_04935 [Candidatus Limnocylindria bacterium]|nr:hypothetical protein [Candidatus Limnocylindria bacterium]